MTVDEVLRALQGAFPGFEAKRMEAWAPVFRAQLGPHEGGRLQAAHVAVMGAFEPSKRTPFPVPAEYAAHLPSGLHKTLESMPDGPPLRARMAAQRERKNSLVAEWQAGQGAKIREARGPFVWAHCLWEVQRLAHVRAWGDRPERVILRPEQIQTCEDQAVSTARLSALGAGIMRHGSNAEWDDQVARYRALVRAGQWPKPMAEPGEAGALAVSQAMQDKLAALARARRQRAQPEPQEATA